MATEAAVKPTTTANGTKPAWEGGLSERIAWVMGEVDDIRATGKNQFSAAALSIGDVEGALRPLLAQAQLVTRFSMTDLEQIEKALWKATFHITVTAGQESIEDSWIDIGGNPMAASSFARKGYLKALFHISEDKDETGQTATTEAPQRTAARAEGPWRAVTPPPQGEHSGIGCPMPDCEGTLVQRSGSRGVFVGCTNYQSCGLKPIDGTLEAYVAQEQEMADAHDAPVAPPEDEAELDDVSYIARIWKTVTSDVRMAAFENGGLVMYLTMNSKHVWVLKDEAIEGLRTVAPKDRVNAVASYFRTYIADKAAQA